MRFVAFFIFFFLFFPCFGRCVFSFLEKITAEYPTPELRKANHPKLLQKLVEELAKEGVNNPKQVANSMLHHLEKGAKSLHGRKKRDIDSPSADLEPLNCGEKSKGPVIKIVRYCNFQEAASSLSERGLVPRPGHERNPKWIASEKAKIDPKALGKPGTHDFKIEMTVPENRVGDFLRRHEDKPDVEPLRYAVPAKDIPAFNSHIIDIWISPVRK